VSRVTARAHDSSIANMPIGEDVPHIRLRRPVGKIATASYCKGPRIGMQSMCGRASAPPAMLRAKASARA
jgi:hypothetical protein